MPSDGTEQRKLAAIMFTDMVGYSALAQRNEALALELLEEHRTLLRSLFVRFNGTEIKTIGDGFLIEFNSALEAAQCGIEIQRALAKRNHDVGADRRIEIRIGIHIGDVVHRGGDVYGDGVNIASRIEPLAAPGGICISTDVERQIRNAIKTSLIRLGPAELKNIQLPMQLFRIVLPWEKERLSGGQKSAQDRKNSTHVLVIGATALIVLAFTSWLVIHWRSYRGSGADRNRNQSSEIPVSARIRWLAVLPLRNYSGDTNQDFFVDGMTDILNGELSQISGLQVKSHTTGMRYKGTTKLVSEIGQELGVDAVVEGSVQRDGNQVLISVQLIETATDRHLWARKYEREVKNVLKMQSEVAEAIATEIKVRLTPEEKQRLASAPSVHPQVMEAYLKGRGFWNKRTGATLTNAIHYFEKAIAADTNFGPAYAGFADAYTALSFYADAPAKETFPRARTAVQRALALDDTLAEAHAFLAFIKWRFDWDWNGAEREFQRAIELNPNLPQARYWHAYYLHCMKRWTEAIAEIELARQLDPWSVGPHLHAGLIYWRPGQEHLAIEAWKKTLELEPSRALSHLALARCYDLQGMTNDALAYLRTALILSGEPADVVQAYEQSYRTNGRKGWFQLKLQQTFRETTESHLKPGDIAQLYSGIGDKERALDWLEKAVAEHDVDLQLNAYRVWDTVREDPRFVALLQKAGLNE